MEKIELNQKQLELMQSSKIASTLFMYHEARTPSEIAKLMKEPANKIHYRSEKLLELGLLKVIEQNGRSKKYQAVANNFVVPANLKAQMRETILGNIEQTMERLISGYKKSFLETAERNFEDDNSQAGFLLTDELPQRQAIPFEPLALLSHFNLLAADYDELKEDVLELIAKYRNKNQDRANTKAKPVDFSFLVYKPVT